ncbi:MAG: hypothetical protein J6J30_00420 [Clostridia bacterium]|nr:hypothetical protein [Clostridia bacterium]
MEKTLANGMPYASNKVGFGIYHFGQGGRDSRGYKDNNYFAHDGYDREMCDYQENLDYMNFYIYRLDRSDYDHLRRIKAMGCGTWAYYYPVVRAELNGKRVTLLKAGWKDEIEKLVEGLKKADLWDTIIGFQYDEPLGGMTTDVFEEFTGYMAKFGKRQMSIFSLYEIRGTYPQASDPEFGVDFHVITPKSCRFLTDVGFDWYSHHDYDKFNQAVDDLIKVMGRDNFYLWQVPCTWTFYNQAPFTEDHCLQNIEVLRKLMFDRKNPGGLFCYTWRSWISTEGLDWRFDLKNPERWNRLEKRMIEIGKEVREIELNELDLYSHLKAYE